MSEVGKKIQKNVEDKTSGCTLKYIGIYRTFQGQKLHNAIKFVRNNSQATIKMKSGIYPSHDRITQDNEDGYGGRSGGLSEL